MNSNSLNKESLTFTGERGVQKPLYTIIFATQCRAKNKCSMTD